MPEPLLPFGGGWLCRAGGRKMELKPLAEDTRRGAIVRVLRDLILTGKVAAGSRLTETDLAVRLGVSRGPVREALRELVAAGLLISEPYRGVSVRGVSRRDLEEMYSLRSTLEKMAFRHAWPQRSPAALADLAARHDRLIAAITAGADPMALVNLELALHDWVYELSGHQLLTQAWQRLHPHLQFYFAIHQRADGPTGHLAEVHTDYVRHASGTDLSAMEAHIDDHLRQGMQRTSALVPEGEEPAADDDHPIKKTATRRRP
ncbi:MAG: GntR family transcriptional regulator [Paracoccaceae bacterium]